MLAEFEKKKRSLQGSGELFLLPCRESFCCLDNVITIGYSYKKRIYDCLNRSGTVKIRPWYTSYVYERFIYIDWYATFLFRSERIKMMTLFSVNGRSVTTYRIQKRMRFWREELGLLSVKDGCSEGACGACTILADGNARKACRLSTDTKERKTVLIVEGPPDFSYSYGAKGIGGRLLPSRLLRELQAPITNMTEHGGIHYP